MNGPAGPTWHHPFGPDSIRVELCSLLFTVSQTDVQQHSTSDSRCASESVSIDVYEFEFFDVQASEDFDFDNQVLSEQLCVEHSHRRKNRLKKDWNSIFNFLLASRLPQSQWLPLYRHAPQPFFLIQNFRLFTIF